MITEGIGQHAPARSQQRFSENMLRQCYLLAQERAEHRAYGSRGDSWGRGIKAGREIPGIGELSQAELPIFVGIVGEFAVQTYLQSRLPGIVGIDTKLTATGDFGVDLKAFGLTMQVKTRQKNTGVNLVKVNRAAAASLAFCFVEWSMEPRGIVSILGWCWRQAVADSPQVPSFNGAWTNYEVPDSALLPMCRLADELEAWKAARQWH